MPAERLYYSDSFLADFSATVTDIREARREADGQVWEMALDRTGFYPASGGQPHDLGTVTARASSGAEVVLDVIGVSEDDSGEVWHATRKPLLAGTRVEAHLDWPRRRDHMQQHSGQHLLSACVLETCGWPTVSFHLGAEVSTIDVAADIPAEDAQPLLAKAVTLANERMFADTPLRVHLLAAGEARAWLDSGRLRKLPERDGDVRVIEMEGMEFNACGGTHVRSTAQIGVVLLRSVKKNKGTLRLEFVCGMRAAALGRRDFEELTAVSRVVSAPVHSVAAAASVLAEKSKAAGKQAAKLEKELAALRSGRPADS